MESLNTFVNGLFRLALFSRFIHVGACINITALLFKAEYYSTVWMNYVSLHIHQLKDIWVVSTFWLSWIMLFWTFMYKFLYGHVFQFFWVYTHSRIAGSHGNSIFNFLRNWQLFFQSGCTISQSNQQRMRVPTLHVILVIVRVFIIATLVV